MTRLQLTMAAALLAVAASGPSDAQSISECRKIKAATERLDCYDGLKDAAKPKAATADDRLIAAAKDALAKQLLDPPSARYIGVSVKTAKDGARGVCGQVNAKNNLGGYAGPKLFVYDGKLARIMIGEMGPGNPSSFPRELIGAMLGETLKTYDRLCKG